MTKNRLIIIVGVFLTLLSMSSNAQLSNTLYFNKYNPRQHKANPAIQPEDKFYIGMPMLSTIAVSGGNSRFSLQDIVQNVEVDGKKKTVLFFDKDANIMSDFLDKLKFKERVFASYQIDLIDFGFRLRHRNYFTFGISNRMETMAIIPHQIPKLVFKGMSNNAKYKLRANRLSLSSTLFSQAAANYSQKITDQLTLGATVKYLYGHANVYTDFYDLDIRGSKDEWHVTGDASIHASVPGLRFIQDEDAKIEDVEFDDDQKATYYAKPQGHGAAIDLGATYQINDQLTLQGGVADLGFIRWKKNLSQIDKTGDMIYDGIIYDINDDSTEYYKKYEDQLDEIYAVNDNPSAYTSALSAKIHVGAEYSLFQDRLGLGVLSKTYIFRRTAWEEFLLSANYHPNRWVSLTATYGIFDGEWNNLSAGMNFNLGAFNLNFAVDNIPIHYAKADNAIIPYDTRHLRALIGVAFTFRDKKQKIGDEDGDGIPDDIDLCPNTPKEAVTMVDSVGCPKDSDGDGVPDYLDLCPDTPNDTLVFVDENGCPYDHDGDGVPDYLDQCPDTPQEAYETTDSTGCPKDSDGDGVPDYLDQCPDTPQEAAGKVDANGCILDTDGDGIADYLDACPDIAGVAENKGCPELKKEIYEVFRKALNGIQFQSGKSIIKKVSYPILNDIVRIMKENPTYKLNISGHTDTTGDPEKNKILSEDRATAVKNYMIQKGINASRMTTFGYGDSRPLESNTTAQGRAKNRRVEFVIEFEQKK